MTRADLEKEHGKVWDWRELSAQFAVLGYARPFLTVRERETKKDGIIRAIEIDGVEVFYDWCPYDR